MAKSKSEKVVFRGYTKKESGQWVAVCVDLNIAAQADTRDEATHRCVEMIIEYLDYVCSSYPEKLNEFIPRFAPDDLFREYDEAVQGALLPKRKSPDYASTCYFDIDPSALGLCTA